MYVVRMERAGLSIEQGTPNVPDDGKYYVIYQGEIVGKFRSLKQAEKLYREILSQLDLPPLPGVSAQEKKEIQAKRQAYDKVDELAFRAFSRAKLRAMKRRKTRTFG